MFTRRTATVTMSAPDASCACAITACDEYLPVPTMSRDVNVRPAIVKEYQLPRRASMCSRNAVSCVSSLWRVASAAAHEIHDFDPIAVADERGRERVALEDREVVFDGDAPRIDLEPLEQLLRPTAAGRARRVPR